MGAQIVLAVFGALALVSAAHAQKTYECRDPVTGTIYQRYEPCPAGTEARRAPVPQRSEPDRDRENVQNDYASLRGELRLGMTPLQVQRAWGNPHRVVTDATESGADERWDYACPIVRGMPIVTTRVYFRKSQVAKIHKAC